MLTVSAPGVRGNDIDANGDPLTVTLVSNPSHGVVTLDANGGFVYTPTADFNGSDSFTYTASDGTATSNVATVSIAVAPVNDPPVAVAGTLAVVEDTAANGTLTALDIDGPAPTFSIVSNGAKGVAAVTNPTTGAFTYTPNAEANGDDSFTFQVSDGLATSAVAAITVTISAVGDVSLSNTAMEFGGQPVNTSTGLVTVQRRSWRLDRAGSRGSRWRR